MAIYIGTNRVAGIYLGTSRVTAAYLGTELIYTENAGVWQLYYNGAVPEVAWTYSAGAYQGDYTHLPPTGSDLIIPRPCSETGCSDYYIAAYSAYDHGTYMQVQASGPVSTRLYVAAAVTTNRIIVPYGAKALTMDWQMTAGTSPAKATASLGLYPAGAAPIYADSGVAASEGVWATLEGISIKSSTFSLAIPSTMWGQPYYCAVSCCGKADTTKQLRVKRLYFTE